MPLKKGSSRSIINENIKEIMRTYEQKGRIGMTKPRNKVHALKIAVAIAESAARKGNA